MNSRERVLTALAVKQPDQVPFIDFIDPTLQKKMMGSEILNEAEFALKLGMDAITFPGYYGDYCAPLFVERPEGSTDRHFAGDGLIKTEKDLDKMIFPDPLDEKFYEAAKRFIDDYSKYDLALFIGLNPGTFNTIWSMGMIDFSYALYENLKLVEKIYDMYIDWNCVVVEKLQTIGIDFLGLYDDMAFRSGPMIPPQVFREVFFPRYKRLADMIKIPWMFHSDGDLTLLLDDIISLGANCINPIDPTGMDIKTVKEKYGDKVCLWGNIDLRYTLTRGTEEDVEAEVKQRIKEAGPNGGYILSSANACTDYCKPENVWAMGRAVKKYGKYPLNL